MNKIIKEILPYIIIIIIVILIRSFIITPIIVSGDSMKPNLHDKEVLLERKIGYIRDNNKNTSSLYSRCFNRVGEGSA